MADPLVTRVSRFLDAHGLLGPEALLLVAVSGGPDSLCLLHVLRRVRDQGGPGLYVAHVDHGTRGAQTEAEAAAVAALAEAWGLPITVGRRDVPALIHPGGEGPQATARRARYAFLAEVALAVGASAVAVAHQADDQAETVLLHTLRGAGLAGLRGMREVVPWGEWGAAAGARGAGGPLVRPLLTTSRAEVRAYCDANDLRPAEDPSNSSPRYARARVRQILATLAVENPRVVAALGRTARLCDDDFDFIQRQLDAIWPALASEAPGIILLRREAWAALHPALQRYALRRAAASLAMPELSLSQVEAARALAASPGRHMALGPELRLEVEQEGLLVARLGAARAPEGPQLAVVELPLAPGGTVTVGGGWACVLQSTSPATPGPWWAALDGATLDGHLVLRRRRPGDRFRPTGRAGSRSLQDYFVDHKVPRSLRDAWPILATPASVIWVAGLHADARFVAGPETQSTIWVGLVCEPPSVLE